MMYSHGFQQSNRQRCLQHNHPVTTEFVNTLEALCISKLEMALFTLEPNITMEFNVNNLVLVNIFFIYK